MSEATENDGRGVKAEDDEYQLWPLNSEIGEPLDWLDLMEKQQMELLASIEDVEIHLV